jgi:hypothetical protein
MNFGPADSANEQLTSWDAGETIWSLEMGGLGPGYEQAIQVLAIEIVRDEIGKPLPDKPPKDWGDFTVSRIDRLENGRYSCGGFSGAQVGAAKSLAYNWLKRGPKRTLELCNDKHRHIQVSNFWPHVAKKI